MLRAQSPPTNPPPLSSWSFPYGVDTAAWTNDFGYPAISYTNISWSAAGDFGSLDLDTNLPAWLSYNVVEADSTTNLTVDHGSLTFWVAPASWSSTNLGGTGPGVWGRLFEVGSYTTNASYGLWSLYLDSDGANIYFSAQTNSGDGAFYTYLSAPISWNTNEFHFVALTYSSTNSALYLDGVLASNGLPVTVWPGPDVLSNGFCIGSDTNGVLQSHSLIDDIYSYNYVLDAGTVSNLFAWFQGFYIIDPNNNNPGPTNSIGSATPVDPFPPVLNAVNGVNLPWVTNVTSCVFGTSVYLTNVTCTMSSVSTNRIATFTFAIEGGAMGVPYDLFASSVLGFGTNYTWAWLGEGTNCGVYSLSFTNNPRAFFILGTPQDQDADGLTTAFENLVTHTDPNSPDTTGDGLSDLYKFLYGLPLNSVAPIPSLSSISISKCAVP